VFAKEGLNSTVKWTFLNATPPWKQSDNKGSTWRKWNNNNNQYPQLHSVLARTCILHTGFSKVQ
jgi:hypothetical protein